jgi:hypothetical protein
VIQSCPFSSKHTHKLYYFWKLAKANSKSMTYIMLEEKTELVLAKKIIC